MLIIQSKQMVQEFDFLVGEIFEFTKNQVLHAAKPLKLVPLRIDVTSAPKIHDWFLSLN